MIREIWLNWYVYQRDDNGNWHCRTNEMGYEDRLNLTYEEFKQEFENHVNDEYFQKNCQGKLKDWEQALREWGN